MSLVNNLESGIRIPGIRSAFLDPSAPDERGQVGFATSRAERALHWSCCIPCAPRPSTFDTSFPWSRTDTPCTRSIYRGCRLACLLDDLGCHGKPFNVRGGPQHNPGPD